MDTKYYITQDNQQWNIQSVQEEKDLGVGLLTCSDLPVSGQCREAASKAKLDLEMVRRQFREFDPQSFLTIYRICQASLGICRSSLVTLLVKRH